MLTALTIGLRFRFAMALAVFAALCFVAPPAVQAMGHGTHTIDCLAHAGSVDHGRIAAHDSTHHGDRSIPASDHHPCCGLVCLSAIAAEDGGIAAPIAVGSAPVPAQAARLPSRAPERADRPPISLLFV